jgi:endothelin-converting enzyme/putative endopeptidase
MRCLLVVGLAIAGCQSSAPPSAAATSSPACTDFYAVTCERWEVEHPVPADSSRWTIYDEMTQRTRARLDRIFDTAVAKPEDPIGIYLTACLDEAAIARTGLAPLRDDLAAIASIARPDDVLAVFARLARRGVSVPIDVSPAPDPDRPAQMIPWADASGLTLPVREDYLIDEPRARETRQQYLRYLARVFAALGEADAEATADARRVLALERALAAARLPERERVDPATLVHPVSPGGGGTWPWPRYLALLGAPAAARINEVEPRYVAALARLVSSTEVASWRAYLRAQLVRPSRTLLPPAVADIIFDFEGRYLRGVRQDKSRRERCGELLDRDLGDLVAQRFVAQAFTPRDKARVEALVARVRRALRDELTAARWMSAATRAAAVAKLDALHVMVGYPARWRDYRGLALRRGDAYGNAVRAQEHEQARRMAQMGQPTDREEWFELPQTLDAYHTGSRNEVVFTAAFLQRPLYDPDADDATLFGALGGVIGHELTHAFDTGGRRFDGSGRLRDWWTPRDAAAYDERAACFIEQYGRYQVAGIELDGTLTARENIADNGGVRLAHRAARLPDRDAERRFFTAWGHLRCTSITAERARELARTDVHAPGRYRVNGVVSNLPEFARAFGCRAPAPMVYEPRCRLW